MADQHKLYTLEEAAKVIAERTCRELGHDLEIVVNGAGCPVSIYCTRCDGAWTVKDSENNPPAGAAREFLDIRTAYLHGATVRHKISGKEYLVEMMGGFPYATPIQGDKIGGPVSKVSLLNSFDLVKESPHVAPE